MACQLSRNQLLSLQQPVTEFLREELGLVVQQGKTMVCDVNRGVSFLGAYLKPWRRYVSSTSLRRMRRKLPLLRSLRSTPVELRASINSFLGIMSHYRSSRLTSSSASCLSCMTLSVQTPFCRAQQVA